MKLITHLTIIALASVASAQDFEVDHNGNWILCGIIACGKIEKPVRMIIDTGSEISLLDASMKEKLGLRLVGKANAADLGQASCQLDAAEADSIRLGPYRLPAPRMLLVDLQERFRGSTDDPIDGLLGMDLLAHTVFRWDEGAKSLEWGIGEIPRYNHTIPIKFAKGLPYLPIRLGDKDSLALFDTGAVGAGFILPMSSMDDVGNTESRSAFGSISFAEGIFKGRIQLGTAIWIDPKVDFVRQNTGKLILGNRLFRDYGFAVDFTAGRFYLRTGNETREMKVPEPRRLKLALRWDGQQRLVIVGMKPGGPFEKAGFRPGDRLVRLGELQGPRLTIRSAFEYLDAQVMVQAIVLRDGKEITLSVQ